MAACLENVRQQDPDAAAAFVEHLYPFVLRIVRGRKALRDAEEDLMQDIFLKLFTKLGQYQGAVPFEHWVSRIAVNHCLRVLASHRRRPEWRWADLTEDQVEALEAAEGSRADEPEAGVLMGARELVELLLESLPAQDALLLRLLELEAQSVRDVAQRLGWTTVRVRVRAFRARRQLNRRYAELKRKGMA